MFLLFALAGCTGSQMLNSMTPAKGYDVASNLVYDESHGLRLDIYSPEARRAAPTVVFFYGGRWQEGDKEDFRFVGEALASRGFVAVLPNYRLHPPARFPAFVQDGARALAWTRDNVARYGGDPKKLFVMGHSSGAHIAAMLALDQEYLKAVGGSADWLKGMVGLAGPYDFLPITAADLRTIFGPPDRFHLSQPINYVDTDDPPMLLLHSEDDEKVGVHNTRNLAQAAKHAGITVETVIYPELKCIFGVDSHSCIIASLASPFRGRSDVLTHISDFISFHAATPDAGPAGPQAVPLKPAEGR